MRNLHRSTKKQIRDKGSDGAHEDDQKSSGGDNNSAAYAEILAAFKLFAASRTEALGGVAFVVALEARFMLDLGRSGIHNEQNNPIVK
jgi:hypothetical protein